MQNNVVEDKLTYKIGTEEPIEINNLIKSLKSIADEYGKSSKIKDVSVKVSEVRKGSFEFDFLLHSSAALLPLMSNLNTTIDFIKRISDLKSFFLGQKDYIVPTIEEAKMLHSINMPIQTLNNYGTIVVNDTNKTESIKFDLDESKKIIKTTDKFIEMEKKKEDEENQNIFADRLIEFVQTRTDNRDYGNKSICESISKKEIKTIFENDTIKNDILDNPYHYGFLVDLEVQYINQEPKLYKIIKLKDKIDLG